MKKHRKRLKYDDTNVVDVDLPDVTITRKVLDDQMSRVSRSLLTVEEWENKRKKVLKEPLP